MSGRIFKIYFFYILATIVMFNQLMYNVDEDAGPAQLVLVLSNPSSSDITVQVITEDGSATGECCSSIS